jgi:excisionase family DNA binding protein
MPQKAHPGKVKSAEGGFYGITFIYLPIGGTNFPRFRTWGNPLTTDKAPTKSAHLPLEVNPEAAAELLKVHPRTVRNMIKNKQLDATKVNGKWFIKRLSLLNFAEGQSKNPDPKQPKNRLQCSGPKGLAAYRLCLHAFDQFELGVPDDEASSRIFKRKWDVIESLGAGFYSYGPEKLFHYRQARAALGALLGLIHAAEPHTLKMQKAVEFLELECNSALGSLLRKFEKPHSKGKTHAAAPYIQ